MQRTYSLKKNAQFKYVYRRGTSGGSHEMVMLYVRANTLKVGFSVGKKLGCAPLRSRCKRVMRAAAAELGGPWPQLDVVFVARGKIATAEHQAVLKDMSKCLGKLGVVDAKR